MSSDSSVLPADPVRAVAVRRQHALLIGYFTLCVASVGLFFLIRWLGEAYVATAGGSVQASLKPADHSFQHLLGGLVAVIVVARLFGWVLHRLGQPRVIGEVIAGIALGPSLLGKISPETMTFLFPTNVMPILSAIAQLGVIL